MKPSLRAAVPLLWTLACHAPASPYGEVVARGGELGGVPISQMLPHIGPHAVTAWGLLEVPAGSRLGAAYAGVDAVARSELLKLVRVRIASVMVSVDSTDPSRQRAYEHTVEQVSGALRHAGRSEHGWERVQRGDQTLLRVWSRLTVPRADLAAALDAARAEGGLELPASILAEQAGP